MAVLRRRIQLLVAATITYNLIQGVVAITATMKFRLAKTRRTYAFGGG